MLTNDDYVTTGADGTEKPAIATRGPLHGVKVLEIESMGPGPFAAMILADLGANVLQVKRPGELARKHNPVLERNRAGTIAIDMKSDQGKAQLLDLIERADALVEGFRPGVMERLGLGPDVCHARNTRLIYGRVTGWGRSGPLAHSAGHDINYIALSGALHSMGTAESGPIPPLNLVGDYGGGGLLLALGIVSALFETKSSGIGQVVDTAMIDGAGLLMAALYGLRANGRWPADRAGNVVDGSAYYYRCYLCADDKWVSVGAMEHPFRRLLLEKLGLAAETDAILNAADDDPRIHERIAEIFRTRSRSDWQSIFEGSDACVAPVLAMSEVVEHPQNQARKSFQTINGVVHPMPAPRFGRTAAPTPDDSIKNRADLLKDWGLPEH